MSIRKAGEAQTTLTAVTTGSSQSEVATIPSRLAEIMRLLESQQAAAGQFKEDAALLVQALRSVGSLALDQLDMDVMMLRGLADDVDGLGRQIGADATGWADTL